MPFNRFAWTGQQEPMAPKPELDPQHAQHTGPVTAWTPPAAGTGQGYSDPQPVEPQMNARGIQRDLSAAYGHQGTEVTRMALAPVNGCYSTPEHARNVAQEASARAHGDKRTLRAQTHAYNPQPSPFEGFGQGVDKADGHGGVGIPARAIVKGHLGGEFSDGSAGEFAPTGFREGVSRRWAYRRYSSPTLGAMYSTNRLRGVLPQVVATPHNQPALAGVYESGIPSNSRFLAKVFATPRIFRAPTSEADIWAANQAPDTGTSPVLGAGMM